MSSRVIPTVTVGCGRPVDAGEASEPSDTSWTDPGTQPEWGACRGDSAPPAKVGPFWDELATAQAAVGAMLEALSGRSVATADLADATVALHEFTSQVRALHSAALGQTVAADAMPNWAASATAWVRFSHRLDGDRAATAVRNSQWLANHDATRAAFDSGEIGFDHVTAIRAAADASARRRAAYREMETQLLAAARHADPARTARFIKWWSDAVDATDGDNDAAASYEKRRLFLSPVGDGWDVRGYLPAAEGAELAGLLNAFMEKARAKGGATEPSDIDGSADDAACDSKKPTIAQRRADALMDAVRAAAAAGLTGGARDSAKVTIVVPVGRSITGDAEPQAAPSSGTPAGTATDPLARTPWLDRPEAHGFSWSVGNGPGQGFLARSDALRLTCDAQITRLVLDPESRPLDIGRSTRVIPPWIRTALNVRDGGCIICPPGERPPGWCEAHHIQHWSAGGRTDLSNLALLCSKHHHDLHKGTWTITMDASGQPTVRRGRSPVRPPTNSLIE